VNRRRKVLTAFGLYALASPLKVFAQQPGKVWRIGYLDFGSRQSVVDAGRYAALTQGLRDLGYVEGNNLVLEARYADGNANRLDGFAAELVRQKVGLILTYGSAASRAAQRATATIPIVVIVTADPVGDGFAASLARPGGNLTGMTSGAADTVQKLFELLMVAVPKLNRIAVLTNPANGAHPPLVSSIRIAARQVGKQVLPMSVRTPDEIESGFETMTHEGIDSVIVLGDAYLFQQRTQIAGLALKRRLPSIYAQVGYAEVGGLMNYGADLADSFRRAGVFVDKILKGAKPGDIPFEQPTRYYFMINRKTANALGIKITNELLARADRVIE
jgi:putative ABC transport system substrate-binding protein